MNVQIMNYAGLIPHPGYIESSNDPT